MFGRPSTDMSQTCPKLVHFCTKYGVLLGTVVRSRPVLGQAHTPRRRLISFVVIAVVVLVAPSVGGADPSQTTRRCVRTMPRSRQIPRGGARSLFARPAARRAQSSWRPSARRHSRFGLQRAEPAPSTRGRAAQHAHRPGARGRAAARPLRGGQRRAARDRARREEPRRGDDEPRQPRRVTGQGEDILRELAGARTGDRSCLTRARRSKRRACGGDARSRGDRGRARWHRRSAAQFVHLALCPRSAT